jgi:acetolactate synthase I/III small subunit
LRLKENSTGLKLIRRSPGFWTAEKFPVQFVWRHRPHFEIESHLKSIAAEGVRYAHIQSHEVLIGFSPAIMASRKAILALPTRAIRARTPTFTAPRQSLRAESTASSTSALAYKALHRRIYPLPTSDSPPSWSAQAAVSNILYETPSPSTIPPKRHILNCLVQNEPGVLSRVSGILAARGFNIDSLVVCHTEVEDLSRMTIVLSGQDGVVEQARRQLEDLVPVWAVLDYTTAPLVQRELLLAKINILGPEYFEELQAHHREITASDIEEGQGGEEWAEKRLEQLRESNDFHPSKLALSQAMRHKHEHLKSITYFTHQFGGKVLDISTNSCIVEV